MQSILHTRLCNELEIESKTIWHTNCNIFLCNKNFRGNMFELTVSDFSLIIAGLVLFIEVFSFIVGLFTRAFKIASENLIKVSTQVVFL